MPELVCTLKWAPFPWGQGPVGKLTFRDSFRGIKIWCLAFTNFLLTKRIPRRSWRKLFSSGGIPGVVKERMMTIS